MALPTLVELAESGAHYGHHRSLTYPKAKNFVYMVKNNVSLINLEETLNQLQKAQEVLANHLKEDKVVLFVGTKRSIRQIVKEVAQSIKASYITERWYGGFLTNFPSFQTQISRMKELETFLQSEKASKLEKRDRAREESKFEHYQRFLGGVGTLTKLPDLLVVGSATEDKIAIGEAHRLGIPVIAIADTDINPIGIDYPIPANDDAPKAISLILRSLVEEPTKKASVKIAEDKASKPEASKANNDETGEEGVVKGTKKKSTAKPKK